MLIGETIGTGTGVFGLLWHESSGCVPCRFLVSASQSRGDNSMECKDNR